MLFHGGILRWSPHDHAAQNPVGSWASERNGIPRPPVAPIVVCYAPRLGNFEVKHIDVFVAKLSVEAVTDGRGFEPTGEDEAVGKVNTPLEKG